MAVAIRSATVSSRLAGSPSRIWRAVLEQWVADRVLDAVGRGGLARVDGDLEVSREHLAQRPLGGLVAVIAECRQAGEDEASSRPWGYWLAVARPFCRHALTNIRNRVKMPR